jgi:uncharacterized protein
MPFTVVKPWVRVAIMLAALVGVCFLSYEFTGTVVPTAPSDSLIFQSALLVIVLGSAIIEHKFTKPADSVVNATMGIVTLITVYSVAPRRLWWAVVAYCAIVFVLATACTSVSTSPHIPGWRKRIAEITYAPAVVLGKARVLYSVIFLFGVLSFYGVQAPQTVLLLLFWGLFIALWPLGIPELLSGLSLSRKLPAAAGRVVRTEWPNIVRVALERSANWTHSSAKLYQQPDGVQRLVVPLYQQVQDEGLLGTGLCGTAPQKAHLTGLQDGGVYQLATALTDQEVATSLGATPSSRLVGFVVEDSSIGELRFETWRPDVCREGMLVWCNVGDTRVCYQIAEGVTREESLETTRRGFQVAMASQLGSLDANRGFIKFPWLPPMNTPVFCESEAFGEDIDTQESGDFVYGTIPGTKIAVAGPFATFMDHHTAILEVTGSGKTELALDLIRYALNNKLKVICIDLTARYEQRLADVPHRNLSISDDLGTDLGKALFDAETGAYGAGQEKKALKALSDKIRSDVDKSLGTFLKSDQDQDRLGIITLNEISNTKATLHVTEVYLTCLLHFARKAENQCPRVLVVVEEAHTVMPEAATMGLGDYDSRGVVSKIAQIALQGRKYGVGLLVVAQRTATVSKTVLTQCNTMITLNCFDETSMGFLANVYGEAHTKMIPNLPLLHALVFGKAVRSERPVLVQIPFDAKKAATS